MAASSRPRLLPPSRSPFAARLCDALLFRIDSTELSAPMCADPRSFDAVRTDSSDASSSTFFRTSSFERSLSSVSTHVRHEAEGTITEPVAAFHSHFKLGTLWQHGEVLVVYRSLQPSKGVKDGSDGSDWQYHVDVFDRVGVKSTSAMKAFFMTSKARKLQPHNIRAYESCPTRGFGLQHKYVFDSLDLAGVDVEAVHAAISAVVRHEHAFGFSYVAGHHCQGFSTELFVALKTRLGDVAANDVAEMNVCNTCCCLPCSSRQKLDSLMEDRYPEMLASLQEQEQRAKASIAGSFGQL
eukprot:SAG31_NODE_5940_length_2247_cov_2.822626_4_plen_297_part_00